jgi:hypothetical protein
VLDPAEVARLRRLRYDEYLRTPHWRTIRQRTIERSQGRCEFCGRKAEHLSDLDVHHRRGRYDTRGCETLEDVWALCRPCHHELHPEWNDKRLTYGQRQQLAQSARDEAGVHVDASVTEQEREREAEREDPQRWWADQIRDWKDNL